MVEVADNFNETAVPVVVATTTPCLDGGDEELERLKREINNAPTPSASNDGDMMKRISET